MSKGGAGKVYFVLYLAVILELLIIIVERDEAEEHLIAKQKESMKIVQSILSQLQTGTGVEGLSTRPQDQIVLKDASWSSAPGMNLIKEDREYVVEVGVTDVMNDLSKVIKDQRLSDIEKKQRLKDFVLASNVREIYYQIWHTDDNSDEVPAFPSDRSIDSALSTGNAGIGSRINNWTLEGYQRAVLDKEWTSSLSVPLSLKEAQTWFREESPNYTLDEPKGNYRGFWNNAEGKVQFEYSHPATVDPAGTNRLPSNLKVRSFMARFKPAGKTGIYKLHFFSRTNKILGIKADPNGAPSEASDDEKINIGTVQLKVKDLKSVLRELDRTMTDEIVKEATEKFKSGQMRGSEYADAIAARVQEILKDEPDMAREAKLYGYINMILQPGGFVDLSQNQASLGFTVRVVKPNIPTADPFVEFDNTRMFAHAGVGAAFYLSTGPALPTTPAPEGYMEKEGQRVALQFERKGSGDQVASSDSPVAAGTNRWLAYTTAPLTEGEWTVSVTQRTSGKQDVQQATLRVYKGQLEDPSSPTYVQNMRARLAEANYGSQLTFNALTGASEAAAVRNVPAKQYSVAIKSNKQSQPVVERGLGATVKVDEEATSYSLQFIWQNDRGEKVTLLDIDNIPVKQEGPTIARELTNVNAYQTGSVIEVTGVLKITKPTNLTNEASAKIATPQIIVNSNSLRGITAPVISSSVSEEGEGLYRIRLEISGDIDRDVTSIAGSISLTARGSITNPNNQQRGVSSKPVSVSVTVPIEKSGRGGRGGRRR